jgi:hypothetical protein
MIEVDLTYYFYNSILIGDIKFNINLIMGTDNRIILNLEYI